MLTPSLEDYIETIFMEQTKRKVVRVKDLTSTMNVKTSSVIGALKVLSEKGYVNHEHYGYIELTPSGVRKARQVYKKHKILIKFLKEILRVDEKIAREDACRIEHYIHEKTFERLVEFVSFMESFERKKTPVKNEFKRYLQKKKE
ncbi:MAG: metal-dependent transcriptional regulator [Spirochaetes bacterium]|nr:metal-dependent transcriptional regulator [Spirochaetota bacterium]